MTEQVETTGPSLPSVALPTGGGAIRAMGDTYSPDAFTGGVSFRLPIAVTACRDATPALELAYSIGNGNGPFGLGFDIGLPRIARRTDTGIPRYDGDDQFVLAGGEVLVPTLALAGGEWQPVREQRNNDAGEPCEVALYRLRDEATYSRYEQWCRLSDGDIHWRIVDTGNNTMVLGGSAAARVADPAAPQRVFSWLAETSTNNHGDTITYVYKSENSDNVPPLASNIGRSDGAAKYPAAIQYGTRADGGGTAFAVVFDYGEYDTSPANPHPYTPVRPWPARPDPFSSYRSGFEIRSYRLCRNILMFHALPELGDEPVLVGVTALAYQTVDGLSMLAQVGYTGYRPAATGPALTEPVPALSLDYQKFAPADAAFEPLKPADGAFPAVAGSGALLVADLDGNGLPGLLFSSASACLYWRNLGDGRFAPAAAPSVMPIQHELSSGVQTLADLDADGRLECVVTSPTQAGYYLNDGPDAWQPFRPFPAWAPEAGATAAQFADLSGDGLADLVVMQPGRVRRYAGLGTAGYAAPEDITLPPGLPDPKAAAENEVVTFADPFGDGGTHLLRIRDGVIECWPGLGYGRFGQRVLFDNAPNFPGGLDSARLLLADVSGSGAADLLLIQPDRVLLYANLSGNGFAAPVAVPLPVSFGPMDRVTTGDVLGHGSQNLILGTAENGAWVVDFTSGIKPYLLSSITSGLGARTRFTYSTSVLFALADALAARPWPTSLPFPVQVLTGMEVTEPTSGSVQTTRLAYHDGFYDHADKAFRGFGFVEQWVDETVGGMTAPTAYTRSWYDTGAFEGADLLTRQYRADYWKGDAKAPAMPDSVLVALTEPADAITLQQAHRALKGRLLRQETYGLDATPAAATPYVVEESNFTVRQLQPAQGENEAAFRVEPRQSLTLAYERNAADPRISGGYTLAVDDYGQVTLSAAMGFPRRPDQSPTDEQKSLLATATKRSFALNKGPGYLPSQPCEDVTVQLGNLAVGADGIFTLDSLAAQVATAFTNILPPEAPFSGTTPQARMAAWTRRYYWNAEQTAMLPLGQVTSPPLPHHAETAQISAGLATSVFSGRLTDGQIAADGLLTPDAGYWWNPGSVLSYGNASQFYQPLSTVDAAASRRSVTYDAYGLMAISATTPDGTTTSVPDYAAMQPVRVVDENVITSETLLDPLGRPIVTTTWKTAEGSARQGDGALSTYQPIASATLAEVLADPARFLQQMTTFQFRTFFPGAGQPPCTVTVARQFHVSQLSPGQVSPLRVSIDYIDSTGRPVETKLLVEAEACGAATPLWRSTALIRYDARGNALQLWRPCFTDTPAFSGYDGGLYDTNHYDALGRQVKTLTAKGFVETTAFAAWSTVQSDLDDMVTTSPYYLAHIGDTSPDFADQRDALVKAAAFAGTPTTQVLDPLGRTVQLCQVLLTDAKSTREPLVTTTVLDILGRTIAMADPRFSALNAAGRKPPLFNVVTTTDMAGNGIQVVSVDSGTRLGLIDALGRPCHTWDGRGVHARRRYDAMSRPLTVTVDGALGLNQVVESFTYGTDAAANNVGRLVESRDEAGITTSADFDLGGRAATLTLALRVDYRTEVDWNPGKTVPTEPAVSRTARWDAFGQLTWKTSIDGSRTECTYYTPGWLSSVTVTTASATTPSPVLAGCVYNADGNRRAATVGSAISAQRTYEDSTGRLVSITTTRGGDAKVLQDIGYIYDAMGNVTRSEDSSVPRVFCNQSQITPLQDYTYDSVYRLRVATGRENPAISATTYRTGFKQSVYIPLCPTTTNDAVKLVPYTDSYTYDKAGNLLSIGHVTPESGLSWTRAFVVSDTSNRAVTDDATIPPDAAYDANGNMVDFDHLRAMEWNWRNRPASATIISRQDQPDDAEFYVYDSTGARVRKVTQRLTAGGLKVVDKVYFDGCELLRTVPDSGQPTVDRTGLSVDGGGRILMLFQWPDGSQPPQYRFQFSTLTGSAALELDPTGQVISYEEFFPYGGTSIIAGNSQTEVAAKDYRFGGKECDDATGLMVFPERYYVSWMGRWLSPDPNGPVDSLNLYEYVGGNPLSYADETGGVKHKPDPKTLDFDSFETAYRYLSESEASTYEKLASDIHDHINMKQPKAKDVETERLPAALEQRIIDMFDAHAALHLGTNPELGKLWDLAKSNANVTGVKDTIKAYTKIRSPYFTKAYSSTEMGDIVNDSSFYRTVELHHGAKKAFHPEFAISGDNLWAVTRGGSSYGGGVFGQHEAAFHLVGAAGFGNRYQYEVAAYTGLMLDWEGLKSLPGDPPGEPEPKPVVQLWQPPQFQALSSVFSPFSGGSQQQSILPLFGGPGSAFSPVFSSGFGSQSTLQDTTMQWDDDY